MPHVRDRRAPQRLRSGRLAVPARRDMAGLGDVAAHRGRFPVGYLTVRDNSGRVHEASVGVSSRRWVEMHLRMSDRAGD